MLQRDLHRVVIAPSDRLLVRYSVKLGSERAARLNLAPVLGCEQASFAEGAADIGAGRYLARIAHAKAALGISGRGWCENQQMMSPRANIAECEHGFRPEFALKGSVVALRIRGRVAVIKRGIARDWGVL